MTVDTIIRNGSWSDGTGAASCVRTIGIRDGHVVAVSPDELDDTDCPHVIDATDKWVMPGMLDIHTHYDVEVLNGSSLSEPLRHGVTTVMLGSTRKDRRPTRAEQARMEQMLTEALRAGFVGISSQQLLFDKIDGDAYRSRTLPSTYAKPRELRRLKSLLRRTGRVLQSGPDIQNPINLASQVAQSLGIFRNPLKTSLLSAADIKANPYAILMMGPLARITNALGGNFRWQPCRCRSRCTPTTSTWWCSRSSAPARPRCTCVTRWSATRCCATRTTAAGSVRTMRTSSASGCGTVISSTPKSWRARMIR